MWLALDASDSDPSDDTSGRDEIRRDMVSVVFDTLSNEVKSMLLNEEGTKGIVYVTQPYMNLNEAAVLRDQIDDMLSRIPD